MADDYDAIINALKREIEIANERIRQLKQLEALVLTNVRDGKTRRRTVLTWGEGEIPDEGFTLGPWGPWE